MVFQAENSQVNFLHKLTTLETALSEHKLIDDRLEVVEKHGFTWGLLCLLEPFLSLCCIDVFSHVRVNNVAQSILKYCQANVTFVDEATVKKIKENLLQPLQEKTHDKYYLYDVFRDLEELPPTLPLRWPEDPLTLGLTVDQKEQLNAVLAEVAPLAFGSHFRTGASYVLKFKKTKRNGRTLQLYKYGSDETREFGIPLTVTVLRRKAERLNSFLLWTKRVIAQGGERKIRYAYDLMHGEFLALKRCESKVEELVLRHFRSNPSPGIERIIQFYSPHHPDHAASLKKQHLVEPIFKGSLADLFDQIREPKHVLSIMRQLLMGLTALHAFTPHETKVGFSGYGPTITTTTYYKAFHCDIKPGNILLRLLPDGEWEAILIDFGLVNFFFPGNGTVGYLPPEDVQFLCEVKPGGPKGPLSPAISDQQIFERTHAYNYKKDVWGLGLVW